MKTPHRILAGILSGALIWPAVADDTDVYINPGGASGSAPLVMFSLDYRANMSRVECNGVDTGGDITLIATACGFSERMAQTIVDQGSHVDGRLTLFELIRAALKLTLDPLTGIKVGLMMSHENNTGCAGLNRSQCSNGGMVMQGFHGLDEVVNRDPLGRALGTPTTGRQQLYDVLANIPAPNATDATPGLPDYHPYQPKEMYFELFRYLTGQDIYNAHNGSRDFDDSNGAKVVNLDAPETPDADFVAAGYNEYPSWDTRIETNGNTEYESPLVGNDCAKVFVINIGFGTSNQDSDSDAAMEAAKNSQGLGLALQGSNEFAQLTAFMKDIDLGDGTWGDINSDLDGRQNIISYFVMESANNTQDAWAQGGGTGSAIELGSDPDAVVETLGNIFKSILSVSTTFVAPSVPVNVFNRAQIVNEVFLALFEAEENGLPLWDGNLKKVVVGVNALGEQELQDVNGVQAIDVDGRLKREAVTFWTATGNLTTPAAGDDFLAGSDGREVSRGGAGQKIPSYMTATPGVPGSPGFANGVGVRKLFTENPGNTVLDSVATDGLTPIDFTCDLIGDIWPEIVSLWDPPATAVAPNIGCLAVDFNEFVHAADIFLFLRGWADAFGLVRDWWLADPLHSRPLPINYGARSGFTTANPDIRILMGSNDGYLHMFRNTSAVGAQDGGEAWGFMPREVIPIMDRLQRNVAGDPKHPYAVDGSPVAFTLDADFDGNLTAGASGDKAFVYVGMRRGGRNYYALNIIEPDAPVFAWKILGGVDTGFLELGMTWSTPQVGKVRIGNTDVRVLIFAGGFNGDFDGTHQLADDPDGLAGILGKDRKNRATRDGSTPTPGINDTIGNAVYIVNAETGALVWKVTDGALAGYDAASKTLTVTDMDDSIPADVAAIDTDGNSYTDRLYVSDTGGVVWRIDLAGLADHDGDAGTPEVVVFNDESEWTATKLFSTGRHLAAHTGIEDDRRLFNRTDVVQSRDDLGAFDAVLIGTGDRADPLGEDVDNWFILIKDRNVVSGLPSGTTIEHDDIADLTSNCLQSGTIASCGIDVNELNLGWRIALEDDGEKSLAASLTAGGNVFFTTFSPTDPAGDCGLSEGTGRFYALGLQDATAVINFDTTNDSGTTPTYERSDFLGSGGIPVEVVPLGKGQVLVQGQETGENIVRTGAKTNFRTYWHEEF